MIYPTIIGSLAYFSPPSSDDDDGGSTTIINNFPLCDSIPPFSDAQLQFDANEECWRPIPPPEECCDATANNTERIDMLYEHFGNLTVGGGMCSCNSSAIVDELVDIFNDSCPICPAGPPGNPGAPGPTGPPGADANQTAIIEEVLSVIDVNGTCLTCPMHTPNITDIVGEVLAEINGTCPTCPEGPQGPPGPPGVTNTTFIEEYVDSLLSNATIGGNCDTCPPPEVNTTQIVEEVLSQIEIQSVNATVVEQIVNQYLSNATVEGDCSTCPPPVVNQTVIVEEVNTTAIVEEVLSLLDVNGTCLTCPPGEAGPAGPPGPPGPAGEVNETAIIDQIVGQIDVNGTCLTCPAGPAGPPAEVNTTAIVEEVISLIDLNGTCLECPSGSGNASCLECPPAEFNQTIVENIFIDLLANTTLEGNCDTCPPPVVNTTVIVDEILTQLDNGTCITCPAGPEGPPGPAGEVNVTVVENIVSSFLSNITFEGDCSTCPVPEVNTTTIIDEVLSQIGNATCTTCPPGAEGPIGPPGPPGPAGEVNVTVVENIVLDFLSNTTIEGDCSTCPVAVNGTCSGCEPPVVNYTLIIDEVLSQIDVNSTCLTCPPGAEGPPGSAGPPGPPGEVNTTAIVEQVVTILDANGTCVTCPDSALNVTQVEQIVISLLPNDTNCCAAVAELNVTVTGNTQDIVNIYTILGNLTDESCCELASNNSAAIDVVEGDIVNIFNNINLIEGDVTNIYGILGNLTDESCCDLAQNNSEAINVVEGDVVNIYGILANLTDEVGANTECCANNSAAIEDNAACCANNSAAIDVVEGDVTNIYSIIANLTDDVGENAECCEANAECCQNNTISIQNIYNTLQDIYQQLGGPYNGSQLFNGQVKINGGAGGVMPSFFLPDDTWMNFTYSTPLTISAPPVTQWPSNIVSPTDADIYLAGSNSFIENMYLGQVNLWRVIISFIKGPGQRKAFTVRMRNPISGFTLSHASAIENTELTGFRTFTFETIADPASLPSPLGSGIGYIFEIFGQVDIQEIKLESVTRVSLARNL